MCCPLSAWRRWLGFCLLAWGVTLVPGSPTWADGPGDNNPATVRRVPTLGVEVPAEVRTGLEQGLAELAKAIDALRGNPAPRVKELLPDVEIFHRAVSDALEFREFFNDKEFGPARELLTQGLERARQLAAGQAPWTEQTGLIVRGYVSKIDGSVQPYGLIVPESYQAKGTHRHRLDLWFHGRGETLSEVNFLCSFVRGTAESMSLSKNSLIRMHGPLATALENLWFRSRGRGCVGCAGWIWSYS